MKTDEQIAKEYAEEELDIIDGEYSGESIENAVILGLEKGRELEREKTLRFAEWVIMHKWVYYTQCDYWFKEDKCLRSTTEELYTSKAFEDYLNGLKK